MATATLTPRQAEIRKLQKSGKSPTDIAAQLGITDNAVYQQLRRMRAAGKAPAKPAAAKPKTPTKRPTGRKVGRKTAPAKPAAPAPVAAAPVKAATPLQSIKLRRDEIATELHETQAAFDVAAKTLEQAQAAHLKATEKHALELKQLDFAERVLKGELPKKAPARSRNGKADAESAEAAAASTPPPVAEPPAPVAEAPVAVAADAEVQAAEQAAVDAGQERPGAPTVPEFANEAEAAHAAAEAGDGFQQPDVPFGESA